MVFVPVFVGTVNVDGADTPHFMVCCLRFYRLAVIYVALRFCNGRIIWRLENDAGRRQRRQSAAGCFVCIDVFLLLLITRHELVRQPDFFFVAVYSKW